MDEGVLEFVARLTDDASEKAKEVKRSMDALGGPVDAITADVIMDAEGVKDVVADVERAGDQSVDASQAAGDRAGDGFVDRFKASFAGNVLAEVVTGAAEAAGEAFGTAWDQAMGAELGSDILAAQVGATPAQSQRYGEVAGQLYADAYGENLGQVNDAVGAVVSSIDGMGDANAATLQNATRDVLNFATAFEVDVGRATQVAGQLVRTGLAADFDEAMALMTASSQQVPAAIREDLLDAADEYGPFFAQLGIDGESAFALLASGADQGVYGIDKAGDALKEFTIRSTDMSEATTGAYEAIGVNATDMTNAILEGGPAAADATQQIIDGLLGIEDPGEQAAAAIALFGTPLEDLGVGQIPEFLGALGTMEGGLGDLEGTMDSLDETMSGNAATSFEALKRQVIDLGSGALAQLMPYLLAFLTWMTNTPGAVQGVGIAVAAAAALMSGSMIAAGVKSTIAAGKIVAGWVSSAASATASAAKQVAAWVVTGARAVAAGAVMAAQAAKQVGAWVLMGARATVSAIKMAAAWAVGVIVPAAAATAAMAANVARQVAAWVLLGVQSLIQAARVAAAWLIAMGPIGLVIALVVGLVALIIANWDKIKAVTVRVWNAIVSGVKNAAAALKRGVVSVITSVVSWLVGKWNSARSSVVSTVTGIRTAVVNAFNNVKTGVTNAISSALTTVRAFPGKAVSAVGGMASRLLSAGGQFIQGFINGVKNKAGSLIAAARQVVSNAVSAVTGFLGISSPSRLAAEIGGYFGEGLGIGIASEEANVARQAQGLAQAMTDPLDRAASMTATLGGPGGASLAVSGSPSIGETVTIRHEVNFTGEGAEHLDGEEVARMIAGNPRAAATMEQAVRSASSKRQGRLVISGENGKV